MMLSFVATFSLLLQSIFIQNSNAAGTTSKLQIHVPQSLIKKDGYDHREALFGDPPYGGSIQQSVYYADSDLCDHNVDTHIGYPEREVGDDGQMVSWRSPFILMVDRGDCTFVQKVRNAQKAGAVGVIIADNTCLCTAGDACVSDKPCETNEPIMSDDGSGKDVSIPSFLMFKQDSDPVIEMLKTNQAVFIEMAWALPTPDDRVEYDLFTTPTDTLSSELQQQFKVAAVELADKAHFTPHMYVYDGITAGCQDFEGENACYNLCTNNGRYCATDPDEDLDSGISGADVVKESLRRVCIWKTYGDKDGVGAQWWDYVDAFMDQCRDDPDKFVSDDCVKECMAVAQVSFEQIESCMEDSGGLEGNGVNSYLEEQLDGKEKMGVIIVPSLYVNSAAIRGAPNFSTVFRAICAGYATGSEPVVCTKCMTCGDEYTCVVNDGDCPAGSGSGGGIIGGGVDQMSISMNVFTSSLVILILLFSCIGHILWKRMQRRMREQVKGILAEYMPLDEQNKMQDTSVGIMEDDDDANNDVELS